MRRRTIIIVIMFVVIFVACLLYVPVQIEINKEKEVSLTACFLGIMINEEHNEWDLNGDGMTDVRFISENWCQLKTQDGWERFECSGTLSPRWERVADTRSAVFVEHAANGRLYKFRPTYDDCWIETSFLDWPILAAYGIPKIKERFPGIQNKGAFEK